MKIVQAMKPRALAALLDATRLPGRVLGYSDLYPGAKLLPRPLHSRVTAVSLEREQFAALSGTEQEAYICLWRGENFMHKSKDIRGALGAFGVLDGLRRIWRPQWGA